MALTAWFIALVPIACTSTCLLSRNTPAIAPATADVRDLPETLITSMWFLPEYTSYNVLATAGRDEAHWRSLGDDETSRVNHCTRFLVCMQALLFHLVESIF